jgi:hypothetical protein
MNDINNRKGASEVLQEPTNLAGLIAPRKDRPRYRQSRSFMRCRSGNAPVEN